MENNSLKQQEVHANGMIGRMVGWLANNRTTIYLFTFIITIWGLSIYNDLPKEQFPDIVVPQIYVQTIYQGTTPADIENTINKPIEKQIKSISGVKRVKSNALQDVSVILVEFNTDVPVPVAKQRVVDAVDKAKIDLPKDLTKDPSVAEVNFSEFPIMNINLAGNFSLQQLKTYAEQLQDEIEAMPEITRVDIVGALNREIQINADLNKMQAAGLTFGDIQQAVQGENVNVSGGELNVDNVRRTLRVKGEFKNVSDIANLIVRSGTGATVRLSDVAEVKDNFEEKNDFARLDNKSVVTLNVIKRSGANLISASERIEKVIEQMKADQFPQGLDVKITADQSERTQSNLNDLINTVVLGFIFVVFVLMFFMGVRDAIFVGLSVPLSAFVTFLFMPSLGFTLNTIVLFAFLLGLGIVVDDAIVVIENSHRIFNQYRNISIVKAVRMAAGEVFVPVLTGTLTTVSPFLPLLFWPGIVGEFMKFLPITLILTLFASLFVAYVINPVFAVSFMRRHEEEQQEDRSFKSIRRTFFILLTITIVGYGLGFSMGNFGVGNFMALITIIYLVNHYVFTPLIHSFQNGFLPRFRNGYRKLISWAIQGWRPVGVLVAAFALLIFTFVVTAIKKPTVLFFPSGEPDYVYVYSQLPIGTDARKTDSVTKIIEKRVFEVIKKNKAEIAINSVISNVGKNAGDPYYPDRSATPHKSKVTVAFVKKEDRNGISSEVILEEVRKSLKGIPGTEISVQRENVGPPTGKPVSIEIAGDDFATLISLEKQIRQSIQKAGIEGIEDLKSDLVTNKPEITIDIDREKAQREGISSGQIAMAVRTALFGSEISKFRDIKDEYPIQLRLKPDDRSQVDRLLSLNISYRDMNSGGAFRQVPLNSIAKISYTTTFSQINRKNLQRVITLGSDVVTGYNANQIVGQIQPLIDEMEIPNGYTIKMGGEQEEQMESMTFLIGAFGLCLAFIFLILVAQFNSVTKPFIIYATILLSWIGVLLGFVAFDMDFSIIMSGVGIISLAGIVVKNGILLIEFTDELRARGYGLREALIEAGAIRMTPVLLTASAAILGLIPLAIGLNINFLTLFTELSPHIFIGGESKAFWGILAWTIIFGLSFSTALTLIVVPCMYYINERIQERLFGKKKDPKAELALEEADA